MNTFSTKKNRAKPTIKSIASLVLFVLLYGLSANAQSTEYPNITEDKAEDQNFTIDFLFNFSVPGVLGVGLGGSFYIPNVFYVAGEAGIGWTYKSDDSNPEIKWVMPWYGIKAGYPIHFVKAGTPKWIVSQSSYRQNYYRVKAPVHHFIIPEIGLYFNPVGYDKTKQYMANVVRVGLSWKTMVNADVKVQDSSTGRVRSGRLKRNSEISFGLVFPMKDEIYVNSESPLAVKTERLGFYVSFGVPFRGAKFNFGLNSIGYDDQAQFFVGFTLSIK